MLIDDKLVLKCVTLLLGSGPAAPASDAASKDVAKKLDDLAEKLTKLTAAVTEVKSAQGSLKTELGEAKTRLAKAEKGVCGFCGIPGHVEKDCAKKKKKDDAAQP